MIYKIIKYISDNEIVFYGRAATRCRTIQLQNTGRTMGSSCLELTLGYNIVNVCLSRLGIIKLKIILFSKIGVNVITSKILNIITFKILILMCKIS